ncbi:MAG: HIT domain-containing protein [Alphaproteobacteria bacterium]|nr:HIT domain-containing protein [Alphaproteobacteria bacterium]
MFSVDPQIEKDSIFVGHCEGSCGKVQLRLMRDGRYFWALLVPEVDGAVELHDLTPEMQAWLGQISAHFSKALALATGCEKINTAAIGNMVRMLHVHVIARSPGDAAWPGPVWGHGQASALTRVDEDWRLAVLKDALSALDAASFHRPGHQP